MDARRVLIEKARSMTSLWDYRSDAGSNGRDFVGYDVEASDGSIGKIDESSVAAGQAYLVVDTGFWIFGKKRLIPAGVVSLSTMRLRRCS